MAKNLVGCGLVCVALLLGAARSDALPIRVVTFTDLPGSGVPVWVEDGVTVTGVGGYGVQSFETGNDFAQLDVCCNRGLEFTTGSLFRLIDLDVDREEECPGSNDPECSEESFYVEITGFVNGLPVSLSEPIDLLRVEAFAAEGAGKDYQVYFDIDNVTLEIVPEPATALLLIGGLVGLAARARTFRAAP